MTTMVTKIKLGEIPVASTSFMRDVTLSFDGASLRLQFEFQQNGRTREGSLVFRGARAHCHRAEGVSTAWQVEDAYDTICEVAGSAWLSEVLELSNSRGHPDPDLRHFMIYLDSAGSFEVLARSWELDPPDSPMHEDND
jgi:hypothetical protein